MANGAKGGQGRAAHPLGGRVGCHQLGMLGLQRLEFAEQPVVLGIGHARLVQHVVAVVVGVDLAAQGGDPADGILGVGHGGLSLSPPRGGPGGTRGAGGKTYKQKEQPRLLLVRSGAISA